MLKNILWLWFIPWGFDKFLHCKNSWFRLSDDFLHETIGLGKFSDLFHKSFHLSLHVMLSVFKAVSILPSSSRRALLCGGAPSYTEALLPADCKTLLRGNRWRHASGADAVFHHVFSASPRNAVTVRSPGKVLLCFYQDTCYRLSGVGLGKLFF